MDGLAQWVGARVSWRVHSFLAPLQESLCICERARFFRVPGSWKKENFRFDVLWLQFAALNFR